MKWSNFILNSKVLSQKSWGISVLFLLFGNVLFAQKQKPETDIFIDNLFFITEVMVTDVASPPAAARFYAYSTLAAQTAWIFATKSPIEESLISKSNHFLPEVQIDSENIEPHFVSIYAMLEVGKQIMPSGNVLSSKQEKLVDLFVKSKWISKKQIDQNLNFAKYVAEKILNIAKNDNYNRLSTLTRYSPKNKEGHWYPTPPAYMAAIEPEWRTISPFFIQNLSLYKPKAPAPFSLEPGSSFYNQLQEVYQVTSNLDEESKLIANFWDCNPFMVQYSGHMAIGIKKISPGGHWVGITGIASKKANLNWKETLFIHGLLSMGLHDAFISCWEEKYDSDRIRPESAINKYVDQDWRPLLQTPPFPEYTSGHSVVSSMSATLLTDFFGENFDFIDTSEVYFGLPERHFSSFYQAAEEAAISRLYGGIHFRDAIEEGTKQGKIIGQDILKRINP
ncbi:vanadium-dependent haloperoxidase [Shivajiella indica]|uniref:Vanadium-dependent haloperoxidase n=1 Tax=Shivajiella indica TaxID=872115 RepID=A0ABW5BCF6_9BACT